MSVLELSGVTTSFPVSGRQVPVVDDVSFSVDEGKCLALVGESGCGKSMTALSILRLVPRPGQVTKGEIRIGGKSVLSLSIPEMRAVRGSDVAMIFQEPMTSLNPVMRVGEQVEEALHLHEKISPRAARARSLELFKKVGIPDPESRYNTYPHQMSGGLKQRVMIAMALVTRPRILLADEPTTALDVTIQAQILELMRELQRDFKTAIVLITHDLGVVNQLADDIAVMYAGRIIEQADRRTLLKSPSHPYTRGLLGALPGRAALGERLHEIQGTVPSPSGWPSGCRFADRCPEAEERCRAAVPELRRLGDSQARVACFLREEGK